MSHKNSRRDFLQGLAGADALSDALQRALPGSASANEADRDTARSYVVRVGRRAMACEFEICLNAGQYEHDTELALETLDLVEALEEQMSYFRESSELSRLNRSAAYGPVAVEPRLFALLELAMQVHAETGGAFDITATPLWEAWGFARRAGAIPSAEKLAEALARVGSRWVQLDPQQKTIRFSKEGVRLSLGSVGKGYALDRCAERLLTAGVGDFLLHGGYSSMFAHGAPACGQASNSQGALPAWTVGIRDPLHPSRRLAEMRLRDRALSTSGAWAQSFRHRGRRYGHIVDPRTGWPAEGVLSATALAPTAAMAEALSTGFFVMGHVQALDFCRERPEIAAVLVCPASQNGRVEIHSAGLAEGDLKLL